MPPRGRPRSRTSRMDAAIDAMAPFGFTQQVVMAKMRHLLKEYGGQDGYGFIELDAYGVLLEALLADQDEQNQEQATQGETSIANETTEGEKTGFIDIPICTSTSTPPTTPPTIPPPPPPSQPLVASLPPPPPPPVMDAILPPPPPLPPVVETVPTLLQVPPVRDTILPLPPPPPPENAQPRRLKPCHGWIGDDAILPPPPPLPPVVEMVPTLLPVSPVTDTLLPRPPPLVNVQPRRQKPCQGWIGDDDDEWHFITLPSSFNRSISPPVTPPAQSVELGLTVGGKNRPKRQSRWDLMPDDM